MSVTIEVKHAPMLTWRISLFGAVGIAATPLKTLSAIVIPMIFTYLIYAFLGGFSIALAIVGIGWLIWYRTKKK